MSSRTTTCLGCLPVAAQPAERGQAGASASREGQRRSARFAKAEQDRVIADREWRANAKAERPLLGRLAAAATPKARVRPEPAHVRSWAIGAPGEVRVGGVLDGIDGVVALHDRRVPGSRANVDHIAITPSGVWVVDAKRYKDKRVEHRDVGGLFRTDERLWVGGRDQTTLVDSVGWQVQVVAAAAEGLLGESVVRPALCFVESDWALFARPFLVRGAAICWPRALPDILGKPGPFDPRAIEQIAAVLAVALPPAAG